MRFYLFTLILSAIVLTAQAQKFSVGPMAGFRLSNAQTNLLDSDESMTFQPTFNVGVFAHLKWKHVAIQPQFFFGGRGWSVKHEEHTHNTNIWAIDLPLNVLYTWKGLYVGGGPVLSLNLKATQHDHGLNGEELTYDLDLGNNPGQFKPFNTGFQLMAGYTLLKFHGSIYYTLGITNIVNLDNNYVRSGMMGINLGYSLF